MIYKEICLGGPAHGKRMIASVEGTDKNEVAYPFQCPYVEHTNVPTHGFHHVTYIKYIATFIDIPVNFWIYKPDYDKCRSLPLIIKFLLFPLEAS